MEQQRPSPPVYWKGSEKIFFRFFLVFVPLFVFTLPYPHHVLPDTGRWLQHITEALASFTGDHLFRISHPYNAKVLSDSTGAYLHTFNVILLSLLASTIWSLADRRRPHYSKLQYAFFVFIRYYLAMTLMDYGFAKIFKTQFYQPEPNTMFTPMGEISRDLLYWSTMGSSYSYNIFMGLMEVIPALLLLFRRTRLLGALLATAVMVNVIAVNFSYFISVKLFSSFLLLLCFLLMAPDIRRLWFFFVRQTDVPAPAQWFPAPGGQGKRLLLASLKSLAVCLILLETLQPFFSGSDFNDDAFPRPRWHGAWQVGLYVRNGDTLPPLTTDLHRVDRIFIHRKGYLITQNMQGAMQDYKLEYGADGKSISLENTFTLQNSTLKVTQPADSVLSFSGVMDKDTIVMHTRQLNHLRMPLLNEDFSWTIDNYK